MNEGESVNDFCWCPYMSASGASIISRPFALAYMLSVKFPRCGEVGDVEEEVKLEREYEDQD